MRQKKQKVPTFAKAVNMLAVAGCGFVAFCSTPLQSDETPNQKI